MSAQLAESSANGAALRSTSPHRHHLPRAPSPLKTSRRRSSFTLPISLPSPDFVGSIASGAHYSGAISLSRSMSGEHAKHRRALSASMDDPSVEESYREVMDDLKEMYCGRTTLEILRRRWRRDAVFEDPLTKSEGFDEYAAQWFALAKLFTESDRTSSRILSATLSPNRLIFAQTQVYTLRFIGLKKTISSIILVDLDEDLKITHLVDQWDGADLPTRWGSLFLRKMNAKLTPWLIRVPKDNPRAR